MALNLSKYQKIEASFHLVFWVFIFSSVNVNWLNNWFDPSLRVHTPPPLSVVVFPFQFYAHTYWAMPQYLVNRKWIAYGVSVAVIFAAPELLRLLLYVLLLDRSWSDEILGRDSLVFGSPSITWIGIVLSLIYRFFIDRVFVDKSASIAKKMSAVEAILSPSEAMQIENSLLQLMDNKALITRQDLNLDLLAGQLGITDKKLSTLLNYYIKTNFTDFVNGYRVRYFLEEVAANKLQQLSILGLATQCGFSSKTTFYRAFKKIKGCTPTEYLQVPSDTNT